MCLWGQHLHAGGTVIAPFVAVGMVCPKKGWHFCAACFYKGG
jgi:hypothetical protein